MLVQTITVRLAVIPYYWGQLNETGLKACWSKMLGDYAVLLVAAVLVNNFVLVQFLGLCPFMGVSNKLDTAIGMSAATTFVLTLASVCSYLTYEYLLAPLDLVSENTVIHLSDCSGGSIYRNGGAKNEPATSSRSWRLPAAHNDELRRPRCCITEHQSGT